MVAKFPDQVPPTQITYIDGRPTTLTLRKCKLVVSEAGREREHIFDKDAITMGAMDDNDVVVHDETVSRYHCKIVIEGDSYILHDLDSTNGTFINRVRVREAFLKPDCVITAGKTEIHFAPLDEKVRIVPSEKTRFGEVIGRNVKLREIYGILEKIAPTDATVVVEGETGTGKEVVARSIHDASRRKDGPFMVFDCGAVPENLIESELFGHEKGSFTGAIMTRQGIFELANGGTVFLDELGELRVDLQPKLLRVLEQREVKRVGGAKPIKVDVRVIAATNRNLEEEVRAARFREDLFYRLSVVRLVLPPLRDRKEDIPLLVKHFLKNLLCNKARGDERKVNSISRDSMDRLVEYDWPGNIRELVNMIERAVSFCDSDTIEVEDLPEQISMPRQIAVASGGGGGGAPAAVDDVPFKEAKERWVSSFEKDYILHLLRKNAMNISHAAREADIDRKYFRKLMRKYGISAGDNDTDD
ncbi:MAG: sigma 54-dependent Fis family transcriptional regulator [Deltaproteobacteria bacterium]|nr:sigma 54-dependent Fis family transcriptional regulator [Deltaproteobacteria bacterium]